MTYSKATGNLESSYISSSTSESLSSTTSLSANAISEATASATDSFPFQFSSDSTETMKIAMIVCASIFGLMVVGLAYVYFLRIEQASLADAGDKSTGLRAGEGRDVAWSETSDEENHMDRRMEQGLVAKGGVRAKIGRRLLKQSDGGGSRRDEAGALGAFRRGDLWTHLPKSQARDEGWIEASVAKLDSQPWTLRRGKAEQHQLRYCEYSSPGTTSDSSLDDRRYVEPSRRARRRSPARS